MATKILISLSAPAKDKIGASDRVIAAVKEIKFFKPWKNSKKSAVYFSESAGTVGESELSLHIASSEFGDFDIDMMPNDFDLIGRQILAALNSIGYKPKIAFYGLSFSPKAVDFKYHITWF